MSRKSRSRKSRSRKSISHKSCPTKVAFSLRHDSLHWRPFPNNLNAEGATMRGWAFYDLECRNCGSKGLLGLWAETHRDDQVWNAEWNGFFGVVDRKTGPDLETVQCAACSSAEVNAAVRDEAAGTSHAMQPAWA
jgi:hypothetical protein